VKRERFGAAGAGRHYAPAALGGRSVSNGMDAPTL